MIIRVLILSIFLTFFSCLPEDEMDIGFDFDTPAGECGELDDNACTSVYIGAFKPLESSYDVIPYNDLGGEYSYGNSEGQIVTMTVQSNVDFNRLRTSQRLNACPGNNMSVQICRDIFNQEVRLNVQELGFKFIVNLSPHIYNMSDINDLTIIDILEISRIEDDPLERNIQFQVEVDRQRSTNGLAVVLFPRMNYQEITFNGVEYNNVVTSEPNVYFGDLPLFQFYYNFSKGIVAFVDSENNTWNLIE